MISVIELSMFINGPVGNPAASTGLTREDQKPARGGPFYLPIPGGVRYNHMYYVLPVATDKLIWRIDP